MQLTFSNRCHVRATNLVEHLVLARLLLDNQARQLVEILLLAPAKGQHTLGRFFDHRDIEAGDAMHDSRRLILLTNL